VVQIMVTSNTRNPLTIKALSISGVTWKWHFLNHALAAGAAAQSVERGAFGAPTFFVGDAMFFGKDRLRDVEEAVVVASSAASLAE